MKCALGLFEKELKLLKPPVLFSTHAIPRYSFYHETNSFFLSSDFENKFVCGEIMSYEDLKENGSEAAVKAAGKLRQQGKPYESKLDRISFRRIFINIFFAVVDGDIAYWKAGA